MTNIVPKLSVSFMFDDGRSSVYDVVFPLFEDHGIVGNIAFVGTYLNKRGYLTSEQVKELIRNQWSLGDHTFTHPNMSGITPQTLSEEIRRNSEFVSRIFGYKLSYFVFPKSRVRSDHLSLVLKKYACAFTGKSQIVSNFPPFRGLLNRTQISLYEMIRFFIRGKNFLRELIGELSLTASSNDNRWFVFFTHDVSKFPSIFDTPQRQFIQLVELLIEMEVPIMSVDSMLSKGGAEF